MFENWETLGRRDKIIAWGSLTRLAKSVLDQEKAISSETSKCESLASPLVCTGSFTSDPLATQVPNTKVLSISADSTAEAEAVIDAMNLLVNHDEPQAHIFTIARRQSFVGQGYHGRLIAFLFGILGLSVKDVKSLYDTIFRYQDTALDEVLFWVFSISNFRSGGPPKPTTIILDDGTPEQTHWHEYGYDQDSITNYLHFLLASDLNENRVKVPQLRVLQILQNRAHPSPSDKIGSFLTLGGDLYRDKDELDTVIMHGTLSGDRMIWNHLPLKAELWTEHLDADEVALKFRDFLLRCMPIR
ncbi:hypothetical protein BJ508DRAFT_313446 [Ascobolus immersus RN42]|uniref:Uncharacterized protein n=1 Tax=Ascobolus immersus RN42 TaxID=1160509 RepID=A0A3N4HMR6_ASCIM|nr:hypothetical protein BJ508DRAFT_313446 [Ascobolus immersus RN42]